MLASKASSEIATHQATLAEAALLEEADFIYQRMVESDLLPYVRTDQVPVLTEQHSRSISEEKEPLVQTNHSKPNYPYTLAHTRTLL